MLFRREGRKDQHAHRREQPDQRVEDVDAEPARPAVALVPPEDARADREIELAFILLFSTFGREFLDRYEELMPLEPGFFEERRYVYDLYPLLVHVYLFGGAYVSSVDQTLRRFGF